MSPADGKVSVPEEAPVRVTPRRALRLFLGRFIVDYIETFGGIAGAQILVLIVAPEAVDWKFAVVQLAGPALAALVSSLRRAWPTIKKWLAPPDDED